MMTESDAFDWARINGDFKGFLEDVRSMDFRVAGTVSYHPKAQLKRRFRLYRIV